MTVPYIPKRYGRIEKSSHYDEDMKRMLDALTSAKVAIAQLEYEMPSKQEMQLLKDIQAKLAEYGFHRPVMA